MRTRRAIVAAILTCSPGIALAAEGDPAVMHVVDCVLAQAGAVQRSETQADRAKAERRLEVLKGLVPRAAQVAGTGRREADASLALAMQRIETRSLTLDPPGTQGKSRPQGCEAVADDPEGYLDGLRRR